MRIIVKSAFKAGVSDGIILPEQHAGIGKFFIFQIPFGRHGKMFFEISLQSGDADMKGRCQIVNILMEAKFLLI